MNTFFRSYPIRRVFKDNFHCSALSRLTFPNSPLILYDQTLLHCFHFCNHASKAEKSPPSTPNSLAICLAFPCKIGPLIRYPLTQAIANHLHNITLASLYLTILAFDKERLFSTSFNIESLFSLAAWIVFLETLNLSTVTLMLCPSSICLTMASFVFRSTTFRFFFSGSIVGKNNQCQRDTDVPYTELHDHSVASGWCTFST